ncbi:corticosteroid-binding globulin-like [Polypterus senegalus]|uniref:corticosteroid-binding globulin-like n=1 Tax=Polypterus senegalus TaxID=55291 RepID=UPI001962AC8C|nr:corticosteroid-binding globulin-like [Polypterus senegalus]
MASLCSAISQFSLDLFKNLSEKQASNIFYSPLSISSALAMVCMGARGNTAAEIMKSLHVQKAGDDVHSYFSSLITDINKPGASYQLSLANRLYGEKSFEFLKEFIGKTTTFYHASLEAVDFIQAPEASRKNINAWVEKQTNEKIKNLLESGNVDALTRLVLVNAIYFKGNWEKKFQESETINGQFRINKVCDDDIFVYPPAIVNYLKRTPDVTSYIHGNIRVHTDVLRGGKYKISYHLYSMNVLPTFVSGAGFIIPGILIPPLYHAATVLPIFPLDDVYFGFLAIKANVTLKHGHGFYCWGVRFDAYTDGGIVLLDPTERTQSVTAVEDDDEETTSAVTEVDNAGGSTEYIPGDLPTDDGPSTSMHDLSSTSNQEIPGPSTIHVPPPTVEQHSPCPSKSSQSSAAASEQSGKRKRDKMDPVDVAILQTLSRLQNKSEKAPNVYSAFCG